MGRPRRLLRIPESGRPPALSLPRGLKRGKPRSYTEWSTLRGWGKLPDWERDPPGYLLRKVRDDSGLTQEALAVRLGCSQQAVARAESWDANPTVRFIEEWVGALDRGLVMKFPRKR